MFKEKMIEGGKCRRCGHIGLVKKQVKTFNPKVAYHFKEYLKCEKCKQMYMINETKYYGFKQIPTSKEIKDNK